MQPVEEWTLPNGKRAFQFKYNKNFARSQIKDALKHIRLAKQRNLPNMELQLPPRAGKCIIVGAAPSAERYIEDIRRYASSRINEVFSVNETHDWLIARGIIPHGAVIFEVSKELMHCYRQPHPSVTYYISSMCHPSQYRALAGYHMEVWHPFSDVQEHVDAMVRYMAPKPLAMVGGGSTTYLRTMNIGFQRGFRDFELYGIDSSFDGVSHLSGASADNGPVMEAVIQFQGEVHTFKSFAYLIRQADEFRDWCSHHHSKFRMRVHGDGLVPAMHRMLYPKMYEA